MPLTFGSLVFVCSVGAQTPATRGSYLIVDTSKLETSTTHMEQKMRFIASSAETGGTTTVFESIEMPGYKTNVHRHNNSEETFYILEGRLTVMVDGKTHHLGPGSYVFLATDRHWTSEAPYQPDRPCANLKNFFAALFHLSLLRAIK